MIMFEEKSYFMHFIFLSIFSFLLCTVACAEQAHFSIVNKKQYQRTVSLSRQKVNTILKQMANEDLTSPDARIDFIFQKVMDVPYLYQAAMGEGDWEANAKTYRPGAVHIHQQPVYRLDGFDCQTLVQVVMAFYYAKNLAEFDEHLVNIAYGALNQTDGVHYYNRNHFVDADFNKVNEANGFLQDITSRYPEAKWTSANLSRQAFFLAKRKHLADTVQVLDEKNGKAMIQAFFKQYAKLPADFLETQKISLSYIPKEKIALPEKHGGFYANQDLLDRIPTPAIAELVYDAKKRRINGLPMQVVTGTEFNVPHVGLLYRKHFSQGELIYQKITCHIDEETRKKYCEVKPQICRKAHCRELMLMHATNAYPKGFMWYQDSQGKFACGASVPKKAKVISTCNRVVATPLFDYLSDYQFGSYWYMHWPPILGVHIEKLM